MILTLETRMQFSCDLEKGVPRLQTYGTSYLIGPATRRKRGRPFFGSATGHNLIPRVAPLLGTLHICRIKDC